MVIFWSRPARDDLKSIYDYIARDSKHYATRLTYDISEKVNILIQFPKLGKSVAEIGEENVREVNLYSYRIIYEILTDNIYIHAVVHMRRNFKSDDLVR